MVDAEGSSINLAAWYQHQIKLVSSPRSKYIAKCDLLFASERYRISSPCVDQCLQRLAVLPRSWGGFSLNFGILAFGISKKAKIYPYPWISNAIIYVENTIFI